MRFFKVVPVVCSLFFWAGNVQAMPLTEVVFDTNLDFSTATYTGNQVTSSSIWTYDYTNDGIVDVFDLRGNGNNGSQQNYWVVDFSTNKINTNLTPGIYLNAGPYQFGPDGVPGFTANISGLSHTASNPGATGKFEILEFNYDYSAPGFNTGQPDLSVKSFAATFEVNDPTVVDPNNLFSINRSVKGHVYYNYEVPSAPQPTVPEPATMLLMGAGLSTALLRRRRE